MHDRSSIMVSMNRLTTADCVRVVSALVEGCSIRSTVRMRGVAKNTITKLLSARRFTRLTNAFSKKIENHEAAVALHYMHYNYARVHQTIKTTPAMKAGIADHVWTVEEIVGLLDSN